MTPGRRRRTQGPPLRRRRFRERLFVSLPTEVVVLPLLGKEVFEGDVEGSEELRLAASSPEVVVPDADRELFVPEVEAAERAAVDAGLPAPFARRRAAVARRRGVAGGAPHRAGGGDASRLAPRGGVLVVLVRRAGRRRRRRRGEVAAAEGAGPELDVLVPLRREGLLDDARRVGLLGPDGRDRVGIRQAVVVGSREAPGFDEFHH
mmetsp:Transcript_1749/g.5888  ORF Transcript_1749/g.5888 Transcript_1749/m.5888 type:complete len:206 (+) Transcript_1749:432-1049(+)